MADDKGSSVLSSEERARLNLINRLLVNVTLPEIGTRAVRAGYSSKEHAAGQALYATAAGADRPFEHALANADRLVLESASQPSLARYRPLDLFENEWFEQVENLMNRFLEGEVRIRLHAAFWNQLRQEPLGPGNVTSVGTFLDRLVELEKRTEPGVAAIFEVLAERGLTPTVRQDMKRTVDALRALGEGGQPQVSDDEIAAADVKQRAAYEKLNLWYIDVSTNLRKRLGYHHRVQLGITEVRGGRRPAEDAPVKTTGEPNDEE